MVDLVKLRKMSAKVPLNIEATQIDHLCKLACNPKKRFERLEILWTFINLTCHSKEVPALFVREEVLYILWEIFQQAKSFGDMQTIDLWLAVYANLTRESKEIAAQLFPRLNVSDAILDLSLIHI